MFFLLQMICYVFPDNFLKCFSDNFQIYRISENFAKFNKVVPKYKFTNKTSPDFVKIAITFFKIIQLGVLAFGCHFFVLYKNCRMRKKLRYIEVFFIQVILNNKF